MWIEIHIAFDVDRPDPVTPCAGVWIEMMILENPGHTREVTPCAGVWIEIPIMLKSTDRIQSLPVRECGLKSPFCRFLLHKFDVTPCAGVWIEIKWTLGELQERRVTPCAGVWIEMNPHQNWCSV